MNILMWLNLLLKIDGLMSIQKRREKLIILKRSISTKNKNYLHTRKFTYNEYAI